jgi:hypothetical protein
MRVKKFIETCQQHILFEDIDVRNKNVKAIYNLEAHLNLSKTWNVQRTHPHRTRIKKKSIAGGILAWEEEGKEECDTQIQSKRQLFHVYRTRVEHGQFPSVAQWKDATWP